MPSLQARAERGVSEVSELLRKADYAHERALATAAEHANQLQQEVRALRKQLKAQQVAEEECPDDDGFFQEQLKSQEFAEAVSPAEVSLVIPESTVASEPPISPSTAESPVPPLDVPRLRKTVSFSFVEETDDSAATTVKDDGSTFDNCALGKLEVAPDGCDNGCREETDRAQPRDTTVTTITHVDERRDSNGTLSSIDSSSEAKKKMFQSAKSFTGLNTQLCLRELWTVHPEAECAAEVMRITKGANSGKLSEKKTVTTRSTLRATLQEVALCGLDGLRSISRCQCSAPIASPVRIAKRYFLTWFLLDILVVLGDWFNNVGSASSGGESMSDIGKLVRSLRAIRILRLLRLLKLRQMMADLQDHISSEYTYLVMSLTKLLFFILFLNHGIACLWYFIGRKGFEEKRPSWIEANVMINRALSYKYLTSLHWTLTQFTPASMEVMPKNTEERTISVIVLVFALVAFSSFVGSISTSMTALRNMNADTNKQFWMLRRFLKTHRVNKMTARRILKYLEYVIEKKTNDVQQSSIRILGMLSDQLQEELTFELTCPNLMGGQFFQYYLSFPLMDVVLRKICAVAMKTISVATGDVLFYPGDETDQTFCFLGGAIMLLEQEDLVDPPVRELEWISEIALWTHWKHVSQCQARRESEIISVAISRFTKECCIGVVSWSLAAKYGKYFLEVVCQARPSDLIREESVKQTMTMFIANERTSFWRNSAREIRPDGGDRRIASNSASGVRFLTQEHGTSAREMSNRMSARLKQKRQVEPPGQDQ